MKIAVRYCSRSGNTKAVAEAIARAAGTEAVSVDAKDGAAGEPADLLFIGGALYAYGLDSRLKEYLRSLKGTKIGKAVVFSTSWISKHAVDLIKKGLAEAGIPFEEDYFYAKSKPGAEELKDAEAFARRFF